MTTVLLAYKAIKKYSAEDLDRPSGAINQKTHLHAFVVLGHGLFILGQAFLSTEAGNLILPPDWFLILVLLALVVSDSQDVIFRKRPAWLYAVISTEFVLWSSLTLVALMSAQFGIGTLLFVASLSRVADLFLLVQASNASKRVL